MKIFKNKFIFLTAATSLLFSQIVRALEINYPGLTNATPTIPEYVVYVFKFIVQISGFILFGIIVYGGVLWLFSAGKPEQINEAKKKIFSGIVGVLILLFGWLILTIVKPDVANLNTPELKKIFVPIEEGIYVCNYNVGNITNFISDYLRGNEEQKQEAKNQIKNLLQKKEGNDNYCYKIKTSGNLEFKIDKDEGYTFFAIPKIEDNNFYYNFAIIGHEESDQKGKCILLSRNEPFLYAENSLPLHPNFNFDEIKSVTLLTKPSSIDADAKGVTLFPCTAQSRNPATDCNGFLANKLGITVEELGNYKKSFRPQGGADFLKVNRNDLRVNVSPTATLDFAFATQSLDFEPDTTAFTAIFFEKENFEGDCSVLQTDQPEFFNKAPAGLISILFDRELFGSMIVIKGF